MERQLNLVFKRDNRNNLTFIYCADKKINLEKLGIENLCMRDEKWKQDILKGEDWREIDGVILEKVDEEEYSETLKEYKYEGFTKADLLEDVGWREIDGVIYSEISDKDKKRYNGFKFGWYDCDGELIEDELDIFEKDDRQINLGDVIYSWVTPTRLTIEEFNAYIDDVDSDIFEILEKRGANDDVIKFLKYKEHDLSFSDFKDLLDKISENLYYGCTLNEILEIIGEED